MAEVISMNVVQTRIFGIDEIPFVQLRIPQLSEVIRQEFGFKEPEPSTPFDLMSMGVVNFQNGLIEVEGKPVVINQLGIEPVRIVLNVGATSNTASAIYARLKEVLKGLSGREDGAAPSELLLAEETTTVVKLRFPITKITEEGHLGVFASGLSEWIENHGARVIATPFSVRFQVRFIEIPETLASRNVQLSTKNVTIEMRAQTSPDDNVFFISSPCSTDKHLALIDFLERTFA